MDRCDYCYPLLLIVAFNIGLEFLGFSLLLLSAILIGIWAYRLKHNGILFLQLFYALAGIIECTDGL